MKTLLFKPSLMKVRKRRRTQFQRPLSRSLTQITALIKLRPMVPLIQMLASAFTSRTPKENALH
tara:strand:+ start:518 stop:709 length:192 start_codon:yes stop_codon:yes gene_type:complete